MKNRLLKICKSRNRRDSPCDPTDDRAPDAAAPDGGIEFEGLDQSHNGHDDSDDIAGKFDMCGPNTLFGMAVVSLF